MAEDTIKDEEYAPITQALRLYADTMLSEYSPILFHIKELCDNIDAIHRSLEQENERLRDASKRGDDWPLDADGVPIYIGDMLAEDGASPERVKSLMLDCDGWSVNFGLGWCVSKYHKWHHVTPDTWERIIEDAMQAHVNITENMGPLVARCKALCERTKEGECENAST